MSMLVLAKFTNEISIMRDSVNKGILGNTADIKLD